MNPIAVVGLVVVTLVVLGLAIYAIDTAVCLWRNPDLHIWPSVTRCQLCEKRIYAWQGYERRAMQVNVTGNGVGYAYISGSSLCHKKCEGTPKCEVVATKEALVL